MGPESPDKVKAVVGPTSKPITVGDLPPLDTQRWVIHRKAKVVAAIRRGLISREEACDRYGISAEELTSWETLSNQHGMQGLKTTRLQKYRNASRQNRDTKIQRVDGQRFEDITREEAKRLRQHQPAREAVSVEKIAGLPGTATMGA